MAQRFECWSIPFALISVFFFFSSLKAMFICVIVPNVLIFGLWVTYERFFPALLRYYYFFAFIYLRYKNVIRFPRINTHQTHFWLSIRNWRQINDSLWALMLWPFLFSSQISRFRDICFRSNRKWLSFAKGSACEIIKIRMLDWTNRTWQLSDAIIYS